MLLSWILLSAMFAEPPVPIRSWNLAFEIERLLINDLGESFLFNGSSVTVFDMDGNLKLTQVLDTRVEAAFTSPDNRLWVHDGKKELSLYDRDLRLIRRLDLPPPALETAMFGGRLLYPTETALHFLELTTMAQELAIQVPGGLATYGLQGERLLFFDQSGKVGSFKWGEAAIETRWKVPLSGIRYAVEDGFSGWLVVVGDSTLAALDGKGRLRWKRDFHIGISLPPRILERGKKKWSVLANLGRKWVAFDRQGSPDLEFLMPARPLALERVAPDWLLCVPQFQAEMYWMGAQDLRVRTVKMDFRIQMTAASANFLAILDSNGTIRIYSKK